MRGPVQANHAEHGTAGITQGVDGWSQIGFYIFTSARTADGWQWVGIIFAREIPSPSEGQPGSYRLVRRIGTGSAFVSSKTEVRNWITLGLRLL
jgi:hypothetical protein